MIKIETLRRSYERFTKLAIKKPEIVFTCNISRKKQEKMWNFQG